ncbi:MAG: FAD-dependent oxidoreductase [Spirochaetes bacterium]|nr:FAD-dependent oxidoreductase [Spirochaetota bacterium]
MGGKKVVVVGAGCAGLSATYTLKKKGIDVVALEATNVAGGRCRNVKKNGFNLSLGAGFTEPQWGTTFRYLKEMDMLGDVLDNTVQRYGFWRKGKKHYIVVGSAREMLKSLPETLSFRGLPLKAYPQLLKLAMAIRKYQSEMDNKSQNFDSLLELGNTSSAEFTLRHGGPEALDRVISPFLGTMVLARPQDVTIAHIIALTHLMQGMCVMKDGMGSITAGLYERVKDSVRLSTPVKKIVIDNKRVRGVETRDGYIEADQVICATDAHLARKLIPDLPDTMRKPLETCKYSSTYSYIFPIEKKVTPQYFLSLFIPGSENSILSTIFDAAGLMDSAPPGAGLMHCFTAGWHDGELGKLAEKERRRLVIREAQKFFPDFPDEPYMTEMIRYDRAINLESPGQFPAIHGLLKDHMRDVKGLYLSGEYLFLIACTEGALATGEQAALMAMEDM